MDYLESIISQDLESQEATNILANANPVAMAFHAHGWKGCVIHMVVDMLIEFKTEQGTNVIGSGCGQAKGYTFNMSE